MTTLAMPQTLNLSGFAQVLRDMNRDVARGVREIILDFQTCEHAYPDGMLPLIARLGPLRWRERVDVTWKPPSTPYLRNVFEGVGWSRFLNDPHADYVPPPRNSEEFTPATCFSDSTQLNEIRRSIMQVVLSQQKLSSWVPEATEWALWEVMENVLNHAEAFRGFVQASTFKRRSHLNILVVDCGRGLAASLAERYGFLDDREAIKQAVEQGGTRNPRTNAGFGLTGCLRIPESNRGAFMIWSGSYLLEFDCSSATKAPPVRHYHRQEVPFAGTIVELELRTNRPVDLRVALGQRQPVRLLELGYDAGKEYVFDISAEAEDLGTRQAGASLRRKIQNLVHPDDIDRLVLDFTEVGMLSSSFADEAVGKLAFEVGRDLFFRSFELRGMNESVDAIVQTALWGRLS